MAEALAAKNSEIEALVSSMDAFKKQAALSEGNLASLQVWYISTLDVDVCSVLWKCCEVTFYTKLSIQ